MPDGERTRDLALYLARALVRDPEQVVVEHSAQGRSVQLRLSVAREDLGRVIGRQGRTARAIRTLLSATASRQGQRCVLEIRE